MEWTLDLVVFLTFPGQLRIDTRLLELVRINSFED